MWQKIKDSYHNFRRHKIMVLVIILLGVLCYQMFIRNYEFVIPIRDKHQEKYWDIWNERASCLGMLRQQTSLNDVGN